MDKKRYICKSFGFEWQRASKEYNKYTDFDSENIELIRADSGSQIPTAKPGLGRRIGDAGEKMGSRRGLEWTLDLQGLIFPEYGYDSPSFPWLETICPKYDLPLYGSD